MEYYCYVLTDPTRSHEPIYVGKGKKDRAWSHVNRKDSHPLTNRLKHMKNKGVIPKVSIYAGYDEEFALFLEEELISKIGRKDLGKGPLLNLTDGGEGKVNCFISKETKAKISEAGKKRKQTTEAKAKISVSRKNASLETLERIRTAAKNRKNNPPKSDETKEKIRAARKAYFARKKENKL